MVKKIQESFKKPVLWVILALSLLLAASGAQAVVQYNRARLHAEVLTELTEANLELTESLARSRSELVTMSELQGSIDNLIQDNAALRADLAELRARPTTITYVVGSTGSQNTDTFRPDPGDTSDPDTLAWVPDTYEYTTPNGLPVARHDLDRSGRRFDTTTAEIQLESATVISKREDGSQVAHTQIRARSSLDPENVVALETVQSETKFVDTTKRSMRVAPHLNLGAGVGGNFAPPGGVTLGAQAGITSFAYGKTDRDNTLRFLNIRGELGAQLGVGNEQGAFYGAVGVDPVLVNIGEFLPLLDDLFLGIGPTVQFSPSASGPPQVGVGLTFGITSTI